MIIPMLIQEGFAGYGIYWAVLEILRDAPGYKYSSDPKVWSYLLHAQDIDQVSRVLKNYGLFDQDENGLLFSPWLVEQLGNYDEQKKKLQEAGRKGAARRWAALHKEDGQAIANPSKEDGQAIAYNITQSNISQSNLTQPYGGSGQVVDNEYIEILGKTQPPGHAPAFVAQVCLHYGMKVETCDLICEHTNNAEVTNPLYLKFCAIVKRIQQEKWVPKHPDQFFIKKVFGET